MKFQKIYLILILIAIFTLHFYRENIIGLPRITSSPTPSISSSFTKTKPTSKVLTNDEKYIRELINEEFDLDFNNIRELSNSAKNLMEHGYLSGGIVEGEVTVKGPLTVNEELIVKGVTDTNGNITIGDNLEIDGDIKSFGNTTIGPVYIGSMKKHIYSLSGNPPIEYIDNDSAVLCHKDKTNNSSFVSNKDGSTKINSTDKPIKLFRNNSLSLEIDDNKSTFNNKLNVNNEIFGKFEIIGKAGYFGNAYIGKWGSDNSWMVFGHTNQISGNNSSVNYALAQSSSGNTTILNTAKGKSIATTINDLNKRYL